MHVYTAFSSHTYPPKVHAHIRRRYLHILVLTTYKNIEFWKKRKKCTLFTENIITWKLCVNMMLYVRVTISKNIYIYMCVCVCVLLGIKSFSSHHIFFSFFLSILFIYSSIFSLRNVPQLGSALLALNVLFFPSMEIFPLPGDIFWRITFTLISI